MDLARDSQCSPAMSNPSKIEIVSCELNDAWCGSFGSWPDVDYALSGIWAMSAKVNAHGGYVKVQVRVTWPDGTEYATRVDVGRDHPIPLQVALFDECSRMSGRATPPGFGAKEWAKFIALYPEAKARAEKVLAALGFSA